MSNSQTRATAKYDKDHTKAVMLKLNLIHDADILARLESVDSKQGYIKKLVRNDIRGSGQRLSLEAIRLLIMPVVKKYGLTRVTLFGSYAVILPIIFSIVASASPLYFPILPIFKTSSKRFFYCLFMLHCNVGSFLHD